MGDAAATSSRSRTVRALLWPVRVLRKLLGVVPVAIDGYFAHRCPQFAAGIAYRVLFSLAPLAIVLVSIFGLVLQNESLRQDVIDQVVEALPVSDQGGQDIEDAITKLATPASAIGLVSLLVFAWAATGMMASIRNGLEAAMAVEQGRPAARAKLVDVVLVVLSAALVLATVLLNLVAQVVHSFAEWITNATGFGEGLATTATRNGLPLVVSTVVVMLLYRFVPARRLRFADAVAGAFVTAVLLLAIALASGWIFEKTTSLSIVYGSLTAALVFLYSVYLYASALLIGAEVAAAWSRPAGPATPVKTQVTRAVKGLFVHQPEREEGREQAGRRSGDRAD